MTQVIKFHSKQDPSVNSYMDGFETRFVTRVNEEGKHNILIYLSSFKGCDQACRICHLTQQGQTDMTPATIDDFLHQAEQSLADARKYIEENDTNVGNVHYNFMARGEPMLNPVIRENWDKLAEQLTKLAMAVLGDDLDFHTLIKFNISTIMAGIYERDEYGTIVGGMSSLPFKIFLPEIYYSIYSMDSKFRKRWLPKAEEPKEALRLLSAYVQKGGKVRFHNAYIFAHNDDITDVHEVVRAAKFFGLPKVYNIVRYNSPDLEKSQETPMEQLLEIKKYLESQGFTVQMVERVGSDIAASCGTFINDDQLSIAQGDTNGKN